MDYLNPVKLYSTYQEKQNEKKAHEADIAARTSKIRLERELGRYDKEIKDILKKTYAVTTNKLLTKAQKNEKTKVFAADLNKLERKQATIKQQLLFVTNNQTRAKDVDFETKFIKTTAPNSISTLTYRKMDVKALEKIEENYEITEDADKFVYSSARFLDHANRSTEDSQKTSFSHYNPDSEDGDEEQREAETNSMNNLMLKMMDAGFVAAPQSSSVYNNPNHDEEEEEESKIYSSSSSSSSVLHQTTTNQNQYMHEQNNNTTVKQNPNNMNTNINRTQYDQNSPRHNQSISPKYNNNNNGTDTTNNPSYHSQNPVFHHYNNTQQQQQQQQQKTTTNQNTGKQDPYYFNLNDLPTPPTHQAQNLRSPGNSGHYYPPSRPSSPIENKSGNRLGNKVNHEPSDPDFEQMMARLEKLKNVQI